VKGKTSILLYVTAMVLATRTPGVACAIYVAVALMWLIPDRRVESALARAGQRPGSASPD
jgi:hypothetical protein